MRTTMFISLMCTELNTNNATLLKGCATIILMLTMVTIFINFSGLLNNVNVPECYVLAR